MKVKEKMDCLFLCQFFYPEYVSSATLPFDTASKLALEGFKVGALCGYPKEYSDLKKIPRREIYQGIAIKRLRYLQVKRVSFVGRAINYASFFFNVFIHLPYMRKFKTIIVYSNPPFLPLAAILAKCFFRCRIIFICYDAYPEIGIRAGKIREKSLLFYFMKRINRGIKQSADAVVALSSDMKEYFIRERKISPERISVIPNWYEGKVDRRFLRRGNPLFNELPGNAFVVSYLGNLGTCQELETILQAIRLLSDEEDIYFLFAGHGNKMAYLKETVKKENLRNVKIMGFLKGQDYIDALELSSICLVSLIEGMSGLCSPSKVYGYMMASKPIVGILDRNMELSRDIMQSNCGYVVTQNDVEGLKNIFLKLKEEPDELERMGKKSRQLFESKYEKEICLKQYVELLKQMLGEKSEIL